MTTEASSVPSVVTEVPKSLQEIIDKIKKPTQETSSQPRPAEPSQVVLTKPNPAQVNEDKGGFWKFKMKISTKLDV